MVKTDDSKKNEVKSVEKADPKKSTKPGDFVKNPALSAAHVYDRGEAITDKMNRERAVFDNDIFFQELFQNYLTCVQRHDIRQKPKSKIILYWNEFTTFEDFLDDAIENLDRQLESIKFAKAEEMQKMDAIGGDFFLSEAKIDEGSKAATQKFGAEDYDAVNELLRRSKEAILNYKSGRLDLIINQKTGRIRVAKGRQ